MRLVRLLPRRRSPHSALSGPSSGGGRPASYGAEGTSKRLRNEKGSLCYIPGSMLVRAFQGKRPRFGERVFVAENATIVGDVDVGDDCSIWYGTVIRGDVESIRLGARSNIQDNCTLHVTRKTWPIVVDEEVTFGHGVIAHGCTIRRGSLVGMGSRVLDGAVIGE